MIISCKNCSTKFLVENQKIPERGRKVQCGVCSYRWFLIPGKKIESNIFLRKISKKNISKKIKMHQFAFLIICFLIIFTFPIKTDELDMTADVINVDKNTEVIDAQGEVIVVDNLGKTITADKGIYYKKEKILEAIGSVVVTDEEENKITSDKIKYLKQDSKIIGYDNSKVYLNNGYIVSSDELIYNTIDEIVNSNEYSTLIDTQGNFLAVENFEYSFLKKIFSSEGHTKLIDYIKNTYFFDEVYVDTENKKLVGSNVKAKFDRENIDEANKENEPRFASNSAIITQKKSFFKKGVYTLCKQVDDKCPPWTLHAKNITHDKEKKTIYYDHAFLKIYDIPVFYTPKFFHPDPTVKRQSGFLPPKFSDNTHIGLSSITPYFFAISDSKDFTFTPKLYVEENPLFLGEYRQVNENSDLIIDVGYTDGYKKTSKSRTDGSRSHIFARSNVDLNLDTFDESTFYLNMERTSNDTYFRIHDINTKNESGLVDIQDTNLNNQLTLQLSKKDYSLNVSSYLYEDITDGSNARYEYMAPQIRFNKPLYKSDKWGNFTFDSNAYYKNWNVDKHTYMLINDIGWDLNETIDKNGLVTNSEFILKNTNYDADDSNFKSDGKNNEIAAAVSLTKSYPLSKITENSFETLTPKIMFRHSPSHMRDLSDDGGTLTLSNLFSLNKVSPNDVVEKGTSASIGLEYNHAKKIDPEELKELNKDKDDDEIFTETLFDKFSFAVGQVVNLDYNDDLPYASTLDRKLSDIVGEMNYSFTTNNKFKYKFSLDQNLNDINYHEASTKIDYGKLVMDIDYYEEQNHVGSRKYINGASTLNLNDTNSINFETRKNFQTNSTEFINWNFQYLNDCLRARLEFRRTFYEDRDLHATDSLKFTISILPLYQFQTGNLSNWEEQLGNLKGD